MTKLYVQTRFNETVHQLMWQYQFIERGSVDAVAEGLIIKYPQSVLSQELAFWFALARGCGLIDGYRLGDKEDREGVTNAE